MAAHVTETKGVRVAVEGCGHGTLDAIYASIDTACKERGWDGVDLLIIGGDFQAMRNAADLSVMACPVKYRELGDFPKYYSGEARAPYLTIFIGGNHEASAHLWELFYGGWVAPNIYYMGAANVLRLGPIRIAGMSGIWKGHDYQKPHFERLPFNDDEVRSFYHVREIDVRKLLQIRTQVDVGLSHDWPRAIESHGDSRWLFNKKPFFKQESIDGTLGNMAAKYVMDRLRPPFWFSAHMHTGFPALKRYNNELQREVKQPEPDSEEIPEAPVEAEANPDEIDLDMDDDDGSDEPSVKSTTAENDGKPQDEKKPTEESSETQKSEVPDDLRAQLPASFAKPTPKPRTTPGQPVPDTIPNQEVRFMALDKCLPGRRFLQLCDVEPHDKHNSLRVESHTEQPRYRLQYDPEWLAITRVFHKDLRIGDPAAQTPADQGEEYYLPLIEAERKWVEENIVAQGKLDVPENFAITAPPHQHGQPEIVQEQPEEYTNPQTVAFCSFCSTPRTPLTLLYYLDRDQDGTSVSHDRVRLSPPLRAPSKLPKMMSAFRYLSPQSLATMASIENTIIPVYNDPPSPLPPVPDAPPTHHVPKGMVTNTRSVSDSNQRTKNQFRPRLGKGGATSYQLRQYAEVTLGGGSLRKVVKLPEGEDENEWLAVNMVDFYNQINLLYGAITEFCSPQSCPEMKATDEFEYLWQDSQDYKRPTKMPAPAYIEQLMSWVQANIDNEQVLPSKIGVPFPKSFPTLVRQIFKRMYRIYAHIYCHHYPVIRELGLEPHLNTSFKQYVLFIDEHSLASGRDYWGPLGDLVDSMLKSD
ncbi:lariat debranching enzyme [Emericellopsis cladophorae]|uniref:Lariat debranching enzyme n=1 Tax=Emericellopsis cladophorae TaxID=2686198 RepID=A0A9P9XW02_9HYPO|nr:lariat debranching enzyme [Emericellopsis cladophorae]KAI6778780.1 lariat debranching enzyme [Emericellopsis cladophorae]